jgi:hypothetical protein
MIETLLIFGGGFFTAIFFSRLRRYFKRKKTIIDWNIHNDEDLSHYGPEKYMRLAISDKEKSHNFE